ncbi:MAG: hypothetical protein M0Z79_03700 [Nitrospiraceae bacterium]|nr:hypothetical protein [Nitrospiraceae bacterium]
MAHRIDGDSIREHKIFLGDMYVREMQGTSRESVATIIYPQELRGATAEAMKELESIVPTNSHHPKLKKP